MWEKDRVHHHHFARFARLVQQIGDLKTILGIEKRLCVKRGVKTILENLQSEQHESFHKRDWFVPHAWHNIVPRRERESESERKRKREREKERERERERERKRERGRERESLEMDSKRGRETETRNMLTARGKGSKISSSALAGLDTVLFGAPCSPE